MSGCGGHCRCAGGPDDMMTKDACATPVEGVMLDDAGKCPCGKELKDCCHKDVAVKSAANEALKELCDPETDLCGDKRVSEGV